jgi:hypothetical protein
MTAGHAPYLEDFHPESPQRHRRRRLPHCTDRHIPHPLLLGCPASQPASGCALQRHDEPPAPWTAQQPVKAFPYDRTPRSLILDCHGVYGDAVCSRLHGMNIHNVLTVPRSPWQNAYAQRLIGSIRRECLDHVIVLSDAHLIRILTECCEYDHRSRPHQSLDGNSPHPRDVSRQTAAASWARQFSAACTTCTAAPPEYSLRTSIAPGRRCPARRAP